MTSRKPVLPPNYRSFREPNRNDLTRPRKKKLKPKGAIHYLLQTIYAAPRVAWMNRDISFAEFSAGSDSNLPNNSTEYDVSIRYGAMVQSMINSLHRTHPSLKSDSKETRQYLPIIEDQHHTRMFLSGWELFQRLCHYLSYYPSRGDVHNIAAFIEEEASLFQGAIVGDFCDGDGEKFEHVPQALLKKQVRAKSIIFNDFNLENVRASAKRLSKRYTQAKNGIGPPHEKSSNYAKQFYAAFGDVNDLEKTFKRTNLLRSWSLCGKLTTKPGADDRNFIDILNEDPSQVIFFYLGVTFNNFTIKQQNEQLKFFHDNFKAGTIFAISVDFTCDLKALRAAYDNHYFRQLIFLAFVHQQGVHSGFNIEQFNPLDWDCRIEFEEHDYGVEIKPIVHNSKTGEEKYFESIYKLRREEALKRIRDLGLDILPCSKTYHDPDSPGTDHALIVLQRPTPPEQMIRLPAPIY